MGLGLGSCSGRRSAPIGDNRGVGGPGPRCPGFPVAVATVDAAAVSQINATVNRTRSEARRPQRLDLVREVPPGAKLPLQEALQVEFLRAKRPKWVCPLVEKPSLVEVLARLARPQVADLQPQEQLACVDYVVRLEPPLLVEETPEQRPAPLVRRPPFLEAQKEAV